MANATWESTITSTIVLAALPPSRASFGTVLFIVDQDDGNSLNSARVMEFASYSEAETAQAAGYISADTLSAMEVAFSQQPTPSVVKVGYHDSGAPETLAEAITAIRAYDDDWYGLCIYSRAAADIVAVSDAIEAAAAKFFVAQSADADWKTSGLPAALSGVASNERTAILYHDTDAGYGDLAWAASRLVWDPDEQSAGWEGEIRGVAELASSLTSAQRGFIEANYANVGLPFSSADVYVSPGINCNNRPIYEVVTADWFTTRCHEDLAALKLAHTARGEKLVVDTRGQGKCLAIFNQRLQQGVDAKHFGVGQTRASAYDITSTDLSLRRMRFKIEAQSAADGRLLSFTLYVSTDELQAE